MSELPLRSVLAGLLALGLGVLSVTAALAAPPSKPGCAPADVLKSVFPKARVVGFDARSPVLPESGRRWHVEGMCGGWWTTYTDTPQVRQGVNLTPYRAFAEVSVHRFASSRDALAYLATTRLGPTRVLGDGVHVRTLIYNPVRSGVAGHEETTIASVVRDVVVLSSGQGKQPAYRGSEARRAQMRIHRGIHAAVLARG